MAPAILSLRKKHPFWFFTEAPRDREEASPSNRAALPKGYGDRGKKRARVLNPRSYSFPVDFSDDSSPYLP